MTLVLASVTGPAQAEDAVARGVDIVEFTGTAEALHAVLAAVAGRRPVSVTDPDADADYLRVALPHAAPARRARVLGTLFAEDGIDADAIDRMAESGFAGAMLATRGRNLLDIAEIAALADFVERVRRHGMMAGLSGALEPPDVPRLLLLDPDILGFVFDAATIDTIRTLIPPDPRRRPRTKPKVDYRLAAPRQETRQETRQEARKELDRIFVHDFVLPMRIGTYAREREKLQQVRFSVDVGIARPSDVPADMRDVLSYDVITDSIRMLSARGHVALVETLAEQIASAVLAHPRAASVKVRVEKLDTGSGSVGVEIARDRPTEAASVHQLYEADPKASS